MFVISHFFQNIKKELGAGNFYIFLKAKISFL